MWPFDSIIDYSGFYNLILGAILIFAGIISFKSLGGKFGALVGLILLGVGLVIATGYLVIL